MSQASRGLLRPALSGAVAVSTVCVVVGIAVVAFFNPLWIGFEQERTAVPAITGFTSGQVRDVTGAILADLFFGPPLFAVTVAGQPVLDAAERSHMGDVRTVLRLSILVFIVAVALLVAILARHRRERWLWRVIGRAATALAALGVLVGAVLFLFFDQAWLLFHLVFFPDGNFAFDPRTERLTQLFPEQFWTETSIGVALVGLANALGVAVLARRLAAGLPETSGADGPAATAQAARVRT